MKTEILVPKHCMQCADGKEIIDVKTPQNFYLEGRHLSLSLERSRRRSDGNHKRSTAMGALDAVYRSRYGARVRGS